MLLSYVWSKLLQSVLIGSTFDQIQYTKKIEFGILSSENAAPQLLTATEKSAKLALKWSNE